MAGQFGSPRSRGNAKLGRADVRMAWLAVGVGVVALVAALALLWGKGPGGATELAPRDPSASAVSSESTDSPLLLSSSPREERPPPLAAHEGGAEISDEQGTGLPALPENFDSKYAGLSQEQLLERYYDVSREFNEILVAAQKSAFEAGASWEDCSGYEDHSSFIASGGVRNGGTQFHFIFYEAKYPGLYSSRRELDWLRDASDVLKVVTERVDSGELEGAQDGSWTVLDGER